ncbi:exonuclease domain-containing protein, partial [bacterium]|nr:exonuclease domain-containing protein [bacterium]
KIQDLCPVIDTLELSKKQRPGTMHNLDALCRRFGVDTTARTRHGALLDAQILAQVYIAMTGGQSNLFQETQSKKSELTDPSLIKKKILRITIIAILVIKNRNILCIFIP